MTPVDLNVILVNEETFVAHDGRDGAPTARGEGLALLELEVNGPVGPADLDSLVRGFANLKNRKREGIGLVIIKSRIGASRCVVGIVKEEETAGSAGVGAVVDLHDREWSGEIIELVETTLQIPVFPEENEPEGKRSGIDGKIKSGEFGGLLACDPIQDNVSCKRLEAERISINRSESGIGLYHREDSDGLLEAYVKFDDID